MDYRIFDCWDVPVRSKLAYLYISRKYELAKGPVQISSQEIGFVIGAGDQIGQYVLDWLEHFGYIVRTGERAKFVARAYYQPVKTDKALSAPASPNGMPIDEQKTMKEIAAMKAAREASAKHVLMEVCR